MKMSEQSLWDTGIPSSEQYTNYVSLRRSRQSISVYNELPKKERKKTFAFITA
jgi:hypothetical protein